MYKCLFIVVEITFLVDYYTRWVVTASAEKGNSIWVLVIIIFLVEGRIRTADPGL